jgi:hypothetical protein
MSRPVGLPKTGGRKKGTLNKKTRILGDVFDEANFDLANNLLDLLPDLDQNKRADVLMKLMDYVYIKPRALPIVEDSEGDFHSALMNHIKLARTE